MKKEPHKSDIIHLHCLVIQKQIQQAAEKASQRRDPAAPWLESGHCGSDRYDDIPVEEYSCAVRLAMFQVLSFIILPLGQLLVLGQLMVARLIHEMMGINWNKPTVSPMLLS